MSEANKSDREAAEAYVLNSRYRATYDRSILWEGFEAGIAYARKECAEEVGELVEARDAYAQAMAVALRDGIFAHKETTKIEIEKLVAKHRARVKWSGG